MHPKYLQDELLCALNCFSHLQVHNCPILTYTQSPPLSASVTWRLACCWLCFASPRASGVTLNLANAGVLDSGSPFTSYLLQQLFRHRKLLLAQSFACEVQYTDGPDTFVGALCEVLEVLATKNQQLRYLQFRSPCDGQPVRPHVKLDVTATEIQNLQSAGTAPTLIVMCAIIDWL